ncbi:hypothetical protein DUNSADRAFT_2468 [Dunaliella salina]|uniref:Uncharacterized protein n=1 Tax=Dunaliella salina TaxID=3046 RepID=A0ABQ7GVK7_DUNSA|nr:hypothetical protein DUNSADRAFT_2468 [Dunaliella salina]|eukprot:KAF5838633.1 hypothetical protein DUNSADRAFT_2468 [Dunaliella salina]
MRAFYTVCEMYPTALPYPCWQAMGRLFLECCSHRFCCPGSFPFFLSPARAAAGTHLQLCRCQQSRSKQSGKVYDLIYGSCIRNWVWRMLVNATLSWLSQGSLFGLAAIG